MKKAEFRQARNGLGHLLSCMGATCPHLQPPNSGQSVPQFMDGWKEIYASIDLSISSAEYLDSGDWQDAILRNHMDVCGACYDERQLARSRFGSQEEKALRQRVQDQRAERMARTMTLLQRWGLKIDDQEERKDARRRWSDSQRKRQSPKAPSRKEQNPLSLSDFLTGIAHRLSAQYGDLINPNAIFEVLEKDRRLWDGLSANSDDRYEVGSVLNDSQRFELELLVLRKFSQISVLEKVIDEAKVLGRFTPFILALEAYLQNSKHRSQAPIFLERFQTDLLSSPVLARHLLARPRNRREKLFFEILDAIPSKNCPPSEKKLDLRQDPALVKLVESWVESLSAHSQDFDLEESSLQHWSLLENDEPAEKSHRSSPVMPQQGSLVRPLRSWLWGQRRSAMAAPVSGDPSGGQPEAVLLWLIVDRVYLGRDSLAATARALELESKTIKNALEKFEKEIPPILEFVFKFGPRAKDLATLLDWRAHYQAEQSRGIQLRRLLKPLRESSSPVATIIESLETQL